MLITHFNQSHHLSKIQPVFLGKLTKLTFFQTTHITHTQYNNIPNAEGIKSVETSLGKYSKRTASTKVITTFLALILTLNNFIFNFKNYLQIKGCAMGTICAPSYANIFMDHFERKFIYPFIKTF